ncbi:MAG: alkaline phosphatase D family protein [Lysobacteraceae bacterium]
MSKNRSLETLLREGRLSRRNLLRAIALTAAAPLAPPLLAAGFPQPRFRAWPFSLGVASGFPDAQGMTLWTRLVPDPSQADGGMEPDIVYVRWEVAEDEAFGKVVQRGSARAVPELAHSVHVDVAGLQPAREYFYRFTVGAEVSPTGRTRTLPAAGADVDRLRLGLASCQHYEQGYFDIYRHVIAEDLDLMLFVGDYIYESNWGDDRVRRHVSAAEPVTLDDYRLQHAQYKRDPWLQHAHAAVPWLLTWDDHEIDNDWAGMQSEHLDPSFPARRAAAMQAYFEHMPLPRRMWPKGGEMRLYGAIDVGGLARLYVLDDRQYRTPQPCPDPAKGGGSDYVDAARCEGLDNPRQTLLGWQQENWLDASLRQSTARWNVLVQQTLVSPMDTDGGAPRGIATDGWDGYPMARERLIRSLKESSASNPLVLGGDIHANVVCNLRERPLDNDSPSIAAEVCATSLTAQGWPAELFKPQADANPQFAYCENQQRGYAVIEIDRHADVLLRGVDSVKTRDPTLSTAARFHIEHDSRRVRRDN